VRTSITFDDVSPTFMPPRTLSGVIEILDSLDIKCTFFVVPDFDLLRLSNQEFATCLKGILDIGHEVSLHGCEHTRNEFGYFYPVPLPMLPMPSFAKQKEAIQLAMSRLTHFYGMRPYGFRSPYYLHNNQTFRVLRRLGFKYDSSITVFKPAHSAQFRLRWSLRLGPYTKCGLLEIPVTGDYAYNLSRANFLFLLKKALGDFHWIKSHNGAFVINFHANRVETQLLGEFIEALTRKLRKESRFVRLIDMC
jgi:peptidoglycan/xylan/chitin deacetylase (PgdA/CDA1 family)